MRVLRPWSKEDHRELKQHSKSKTPVAKISKAMKRTPGALRQAAWKAGYRWAINARNPAAEFFVVFTELEPSSPGPFACKSAWGPDADRRG